MSCSYDANFDTSKIFQVFSLQPLLGRPEPPGLHRRQQSEAALHRGQGSVTANVNVSIVTNRNFLFSLGGAGGWRAAPLRHIHPRLPGPGGPRRLLGELGSEPQARLLLGADCQ